MGCSPHSKSLAMTWKLRNYDRTNSGGDGYSVSVTGGTSKRVMNMPRRRMASANFS